MFDATRNAQNRCDTPSNKALLRQHLLQKRELMPESERQHASSVICQSLAKFSVLSEAETIAAFWPIRSEVDLTALLVAWSAQGKRIALPVMKPDGLIFRLWHPEAKVQKKAFGIIEPEPDNEEISPSILLVPLVGFDRSRNRLGYGKGYYDRAIARLQNTKSLMTIGIAFAMQEVACIPVESHDQPLDLIVTEAERIGVVSCPA